MKLAHILLADPVQANADLFAAQCQALAHTRLVATSTASAFALAQTHLPQLVLFALELPGEPAPAFAGELRRLLPDALLLATFRELAASQLKPFKRAGVNQLLAHPPSVVEIFRAASHHFSIPFRRHPRFAVSLDVTRIDGVFLGRTLDVSEGGLAMETGQPLTLDSSIMIQITLPENRSIKTRLKILSITGHPATQQILRGEFLGLRGDAQRLLLAYMEELAAKEAAREEATRIKEEQMRQQQEDEDDDFFGL